MPVRGLQQTVAAMITCRKKLAAGGPTCYILPHVAPAGASSHRQSSSYATSDAQRPAVQAQQVQVLGFHRLCCGAKHDRGHLQFRQESTLLFC